MFATSHSPFTMVKRACPFTGDMDPQVKIRVGQKEVATGVMSNHHMKLVFDKTKDLLFLGAKKYLATPPAESVLDNSKMKTVSLSTNSSQGSSMKQMRLTIKGHLSSSNDLQVVPLQKKVPCSKCSMWNPSDMQSCSFCDSSLCSSCSQVCTKCKDLFCASCSFDAYDISDGYICRNCC